LRLQQWPHSPQVSVSIVFPALLRLLLRRFLPYRLSDLRQDLADLLQRFLGAARPLWCDGIASLALVATSASQEVLQPRPLRHLPLPFRARTEGGAAAACVSKGERGQSAHGPAGPRKGECRLNAQRSSCRPVETSSRRQTRPSLCSATYALKLSVGVAHSIAQLVKSKVAHERNQVEVALMTFSRRRRSPPRAAGAAAAAS